jgi:hypothetical protein
MIRKEDYIKINKGQCVFTGVLLINGWDGGVEAVFGVRHYKGLKGY